MNKKIFVALALCTGFYLSSVTSNADAKPQSKQSRSKTKSTKQSPQMQYVTKLAPLIQAFTSQTVAMDEGSMDNTSYSEMMKRIAALRGTMKKMRAISPVPKSLAKADKLLVEWTLSMDKCMDIMKIYAGNKNSDVLKAYLQQREEATILRNTFFDELERASDPGVKSKIYVDG